MNRTLNVFANILEGTAAMLLLFSALQADGGLPFWLPMALTGTVLGSVGLVLSWLCSPEGLTFRKAHFGQPPAPQNPPRPASVIPFPKAG